MKQLTIEIEDKKTLKLIKALADLKLIKLLKPTKSKGDTLADRLEGSIASSKANKIQKELANMRDEWERRI